MLPRVIKGANNVVGEKQEYTNLRVRKELVDVDGQEHTMISSAWEPTPAEMQTILRGGSIILRILADRQPPVKLEVEEP